MVEQAVSPFVVIVDGQEKRPYAFRNIPADAKEGRGPLKVRWKWAHLRSGDYSIEGFEDRIAIERKSLADLYSTLGQHRERFEAEIERLSYFDFAAIVIEASWETILRAPPERSRLKPKSIWYTAIAWEQRYGVPWWPCENRRMAEIGTYRMLDRWWRDEHEGKGRPRRVCRRCGGPFVGGPFGR